GEAYADVVEGHQGGDCPEEVTHEHIDGVYFVGVEPAFVA
ncbi:MAG: hypothetical protein RIS47_310, partial [Bacteroidota bacterium]